MTTQVIFYMVIYSLAFTDNCETSRHSFLLKKSRAHHTSTKVMQIRTLANTVYHVCQVSYTEKLDFVLGL